jgi:peptidoglycan hydrolase-like protein with peptidoglycan-binding domain
VVARRSNQQQPTPDRYREIQQALGEKGYFAGEPDGTWGAESVEALKRFQRDQNLTEDGKIGALSLIALGLGPRRTAPESTIETVAPEKSASEKQHDPQLNRQLENPSR